MPFKYPSPVDRLLAHSVLDPETGCWIWTGSRFPTNQRPRIAVRIKGKSQWVTVARFIVQFVHGCRWGLNESRRKLGAHNCDNSQCVHSNHVKRGTPLSNNRDTVKRGRHVSGFVEYNRSRRDSHV